MYVEAVLGAPSEPYANDITNDVNALAVYNAVRARAGYLPVTSVSRNELLQERKFEFAFENQRWFDLQRVVELWKHTDRTLDFYQSRNLLR